MSEQSMQRHALNVISAVRGLAHRPAPPVRLVTLYGRYDRAAVVERAKELMADGLAWGGALTAAYQEAATELRARGRR